MPRKFYTLVESKHYRESLKSLGASARKADDFLEGITFLLARTPYCGQKVPGSRQVWSIQSDDFILYYSIEPKDRVLLLAVRKAF